MDLGFIADIFTSSGLGGLIGGVTSLLIKREERKERQQDQLHEIRLTKLSLAEQKLEQSHELAVINKKIDKAEVEGEIKIEGKEVDAFIASQNNQPTGGGLRWVRPIITFYLLVMATAISIRVFAVTGGIEGLSVEKQAEMLLQIIDSIMFLATLSVSWWFAARGTSSRRAES